MAAVGVALLAGEARGAAVTLTAGDAINTSSFNTAGHWSDGQAPQAGNDYTVAGGTTLRTPADNLDHTFAGDSLTIGSGAVNSGFMGFKFVSGAHTITINDLRINGGQVANSTDSTTATLAGNIALQAGGAYFLSQPGTGRTIILTATVSGVGKLNANPSSASGNIVLNPAGMNTYSGGTTISSQTLDVKADHALGTGGVTVNAGATLLLENGATNDYVADAANVIVASSGLVNLSFNGTDTIGGLSLDGGATSAALGTWGAPGSGADHTDGHFSGTGMVLVTAAAVPEPTGVAMIGLGVSGLAARRRRRASVG